MLFIFDTTTTMKDYNCEYYWIAENLVERMTIEAETLDEALKKYQAELNENGAVDISDNALKMKKPMYKDVKNVPKQSGYVITGKTWFTNTFGNEVRQYVDLWVEVLTVIDTRF